MAYSIKLGDITKTECDVIVNSIGINGSIYGRLCESIINAANSLEIKKYIDTRTNSPVGFIYETKPGDLPCKQLYHIVTPHKFMDDDNNTMLRQAYSDIIYKAINQGYKSITLPFIGTGANGYSEQEAYEIIVDICGRLAIQEEVEDRDILDITIISFLKPKKKKKSTNEYVERPCSNEIRIFKEMEYYDKMLHTCDVCSVPQKKNYKSKSSSNQALVNNILKCAKFMNAFDPDELIKPYYDKYYRPYDFVEDYVEHNDISTLILNENGIGKKYKSKLKTGAIEMEKHMLYTIAYLLKMNKSNLIQFMFAAGYSFLPSDELDLFMIDYMNGKYGKINLYYDFQVKCYDVTGIWIQFNYK